jgi:hypothetical protein
MYEPLESLQPQAPPMNPTMFATGAKLALPTQPQQQQAAPAPPPPAPTAQQQGKWPDVSDYFNNWDWLYIVVGVLVIEVLVIGLTRFFPDLLGKNLNIWYNRFKWSGVIADVGIILIGFAIARYVYTEYIYPNKDWNSGLFTATTVVVQVVHDILFYFGVIGPVPRGNNAMIDLFKDYAGDAGAKVIAGDSAMMVGSTFMSMLLKSAPGHAVVAVGLLALYAVPYLLETRNQFSGIA